MTPPRRLLLKYINLLVLVIVFIVVSQNIVYLLKKSINDENRDDVAIIKAEANSSSCESNQIWIELNRIIFIKRSSAFYFADLGLLKFFYVASSRIPFNITTELSVLSQEGDVLHRENISDSPSYVYSIGNYMIKIVEAKLPGEVVKEENDSMYLSFYSGKQKTNVPLEVKIKTSGKYSEKRSAIICSKCFFLNSEEDYRHFDWWLELNKNIGYEKVSFCENSIDLTYFKHQANLIETESLKCLPNFIKNTSKDKYLTSLTQLRYNGVFSYASTDIFNVIITNQCYLKNLDKYKYITVVDNDETVIPRISESHTTLDDYHEFLINANLDTDYTEIERQVDSIKCSEQHHRITDYMDRIKPKNDPTSISFYFQQAFYLNHDIMDKLLDLLGEKLATSTYTTGEWFNVTLAESGEFNYTFQISNEDELKYARNLVKMSKNYVRPFMEKNRDKLGKLSDNYRRVFALVSEGDNQFTSGKSVHTTNHTRNVCVHSLCGKRDRLVRQSIGHLAHFRRFFIFRKFILFSIKQLVFDFNYLNCFVKPILNK